MIVAVSCLIGIGMTSFAAEGEYEDFEVGTIYNTEEFISISASEVAIRTSPVTVSFFHKGDVLGVAMSENEKGEPVMGFWVATNDTESFLPIDMENVSETTQGIKLVSGDGTSSNPYVFRSHNPEYAEADNVIDLIDALPAAEDVTPTEDCKSQIEKARAAYDDLDEGSQAYVGEGRKEKLEACEAALKVVLADKEAADTVQALIDNLPEPGKVNEKSKANIETARAAYEKLTDNQKKYVDTTRLVEDEKQLLINKAAKVVELIEVIGKVDLSDECASRIKAARDEYDALTDDEKKYVENYEVLTEAENEYDSLLKAAAAKVTELIGAIGKVELTDECKAKITAAREAYDALPTAGKEYVNNYGVLTAAEEEYAALSKEAADKEAEDAKNSHPEAKNVMALIDAIGKVEATDACEDRINAARNAYNALPDNEKVYVKNFDVLTNAEKEYVALRQAEALKKAEDAINALPDADKVTIDHIFEVYDAALLYEDLSDETKANVSADLKNKLDAVVKAFFAIATDAAEKMYSDFGDLIDAETIEYSKAPLEVSRSVVAEGRQPTIDELEDIALLVIVTDYALYDHYYVMSGDNPVWILGSKDALVFRLIQAGIYSKLFDDTFESFDFAGRKIYIDGGLVDSKYFTAEDGSVILTIIPDLLNTLSVGEHTLTVMFDNAVTVTTKFTVRAPSTVPSSGETASHYAILGISVVLLAGAVLVFRKRMVDSVK